VRSSVWAKAIAVAMGLSLVAAACGDDEEGTDATGTASGTETTVAPEGEGEGEGEGGDFSACQVTDTGGVDDGSFNETAYAGLERAAEEIGFEPDFLQSEAESDFAPNIEAFIEQGCSVIITVGFLLGDATAAAAEANPDQEFAIVDFDFFDADAGEDVTYDNVAELTFSTDQAAFLAGYMAAAMSQTGTVGTYGGINIPTVTVFMDGFANGVAHHNEQKGTDVQVIGWDVEAQDGLFTGDFEDQTLGRQTTETLLDQGADIILPVAGPVGLGTIEAIRAGGGDQKIIWVDSDGCQSVPDACDMFLTSIQKKMDNAVFDTIVAAAEGEFPSGLYVGTLENDGVGLPEYREDIPQELRDELDALREQIIAGEIETQ
jgi:basic membrane protein A